MAFLKELHAEIFKKDGNILLIEFYFYFYFYFYGGYNYLQHMPHKNDKYRKNPLLILMMI